MELSAGDDRWEGRSGDLLVIPEARHSLAALEDSAILLTVAMRGYQVPEGTRPGGGGTAAWSDMHEVLSAAHAEVLASPSGQVEGLDRAVCGPHLKHLSELAAAAAAEGVSPDQWRGDVLAHAGPSAAGALESAESCMRQSGLWPWTSPDFETSAPDSEG